MKKIFTLLMILASVFIISCENDTPAPEPKSFDVTLISESGDIREYKINDGEAFTFPELENKADGSVARAVLADNGICYFPGDKVVITEDVVFEVIWTDYTYEINAEGTLVSVKGTSKDLVIPHVVDGKEIKTIGENLLLHNSIINHVYIQNGIDEIGDSAFECHNLVDVYVPSSVVTVGNKAFSCSELLRIVFEGKEIPNWKTGWDMGFTGSVVSAGSFMERDGVVYAKMQDKGETVLQVSDYHGKWPMVTIPESIDGCPVRIIASDAFKGNSKVRIINLPEGLESIGMDAFANSSVRILNLPSSLVELAHGSLSNMEYVEELKLPDGIKVLPDFALAYNTNLKSVELPADLEIVGQLAFAGSTKISKLVLPEGVKLQSSVFHDWKNSQTISFASRNDMLGSDNSWNTGSDAKVVFRDDFTTDDGFSYAHIDPEHLMLVDVRDKTSSITIKSKAFDPITEKELPVTEIGDGIFNGNTDITEVTIEEGIKKIGKSLFRDCSNLDSVTLPNSLLEIPDEAFYGCTKLKTIEIPAAVQTIGMSAFSQSGLESIVIPASVDSMGIKVFYDCGSLGSVVFNAGSKIKSIPDEAFRLCYLLKTVELPAELEGIGKYAFSSTGAEVFEITIPASVNTIGERAFSDSKLTKLMFEPDSALQTIGKSAFQNCSDIVDIQLPEGLKTIGDSAFNSCNGLKTVRIPASLVNMGSGVFYSSSLSTTITIAADCDESLWADDWCENDPRFEIVREGETTTP